MIINIPITLCLSMAAALLGGVLRKDYTNKAAEGLASVFLFNCIMSGVAAVAFLLWGGLGEVSSYTLWLGLAFGLVTVVQGVAALNALRIGPMSITNVLLNFSVLITALSGMLFFDETLSWWQGVGIAWMLVSFICLVKKKADEQKASWRWLGWCMVAWICTGGIGLMQKAHQSSAHKGELNAFLIVAFAFSFLFSLLATWVIKKKEDTALFAVSAEKGNKRTERRLLLWILLVGVLGAVNNKLNLYLSGAMDSAVFFPIVNGGGLVLSVLAGLLVFKERLTKKQWLGIGFGVASVIFLCL